MNFLQEPGNDSGFEGLCQQVRKIVFEKVSWFAKVRGVILWRFEGRDKVD